MRKWFNTKNLLIAVYCLVFLLGGFILDSRMGCIEGTRNTTEIYNQPFDASLQIKNLEYSDISPAGFTIKFDTNKTTGDTLYSDDVNGLVVEWIVYPSDIFMTTPVYIQLLERQWLAAKIETYPEGGTVMFRVINYEQNCGSLWFYIDLPRPTNENTILPPPYMPERLR